MLGKRAMTITPSATYAMVARIADMRAAGEDILSFSMGEPDFETSRPIIEACVQALKEGKTKYTPASGITALKEAICEKLWRENHLCYSHAQICVSTGAKQALSNAVFPLCDEGTRY